MVISVLKYICSEITWNNLCYNRKTCNMADSLLTRTLKQLSRKERTALVEFTRCGCFNRREEVSRLCAYLAENIDNPDRKALDPSSLFTAAFPSQVFNNAALRHTMSYLLSVLRQYLAWAEWQSDMAEQRRYLLSALRNRNLDVLLEKELNRAESALENPETQDAGFYFQRYRMQQERLEKTARHERSARINLQPLPDELTVFYLAEMLRHACSALSHQAIAGQEYRFNLLEKLLELAETEGLLDVPVIAMYYQAYQMLRAPEASAPLERLKTLLLEHENRFSQKEMRGLYLLAINGCIRRMNSGRREYIREAFDLYRAALERDFLTENGVLSGFTYKNIIRIGAALEEHSWTEQFLEDYRTALLPRERDNLYRYNRAFLYFHQQDYARAMPLLQQVELEDTLNNLDARRMLLRSYFELGEWAALESLLQSFGAYLRRQKNLGYHRQTNERLLYFTRRLMELDRGQRQAVEALRVELEATTELAERSWLLSQVTPSVRRRGQIPE